MRIGSCSGIRNLQQFLKLTFSVLPFPDAQRFIFKTSNEQFCKSRIDGVSNSFECERSNSTSSINCNSSSEIGCMSGNSMTAGPPQRTRDARTEAARRGGNSPETELIKLEKSEAIFLYYDTKLSTKPLVSMLANLVANHREPKK